MAHQRYGPPPSIALPSRGTSKVSGKCAITGRWSVHGKGLRSPDTGADQEG
jgi:hypothetical protein